MVEALTTLVDCSLATEIFLQQPSL